ncbi:2Fe-2S iron-sulfur cluster-binding protein [Sciscionella sediminilitoris]|uniref:2Fe-2S iron-sulfur cluster-binding protein n=1 Tax=Sciscionella sediminilitoris TaxID=1445613 RepID=UPI0004DFA221|nr:2Fe-2S iron-sulfur cluster-binding protein [Sciscionella sp. SE31]
MARIEYRNPDGSRQQIEVTAGTSVMRAALEGGVAGIIGECGGQAMCATCHVYVPDQAGLPPVSEDEEEMLDCTAAERTGQSRLGCQLRGGEHFTELTVHVPETQV